MALPAALMAALPTLLSMGLSVAQAIDLFRRGKNPLGEDTRIEPYSEESEMERKFKERLMPRAQNLLEGRLAELERPYRSPYERLAQSPMAPLLMGMAPGLWRDLSGDPEAGFGEVLSPLISGLTAQQLPALAQWLQSFGQQQQQQQPPSTAAQGRDFRNMNPEQQQRLEESISQQTPESMQQPNIPPQFRGMTPAELRILFQSVLPKNNEVM